MDYEKVYVAVTLKVDREGNVRPLSFEWEDGRVFAVDRVLSQGMAPARHVGAILTKRFDIKVAGAVRGNAHQPMVCGKAACMKGK